MINHKHPTLAKNTLVTVFRTVKGFHEKTQEHGPKTLKQAIADKDMPTHQGTVWVSVRVESGPHKGANAYEDSNGTWRAQYDPACEHPNGEKFWEREAREAAARTTVIKFYSGDLANGNLNEFDTYLDARADYEGMVAIGAESELATLQARADEAEKGEWYIEPNKKNAEARSRAFHYVNKVTIVLDGDGEIVSEDVDTLDGGDAEACDFQQ